MIFPLLAVGALLTLLEGQPGMLVTIATSVIYFCPVIEIQI